MIGPKTRLRGFKALQYGKSTSSAHKMTEEERQRQEYKDVMIESKRDPTIVKIFSRPETTKSPNGRKSFFSSRKSKRRMA